MVFNFQNSIYQPAIFWNKALPSWLKKLIGAVLLAATFLFLLFFLFPKSHLAPIELQPNQNLALFIFFLNLYVTFLLFLLFIKKYLDKPTIKNFGNLADLFDLEGGLILDEVIKFSKSRRVSITPSLVIYFFLQRHFINFIFERLVINKSDFQKHFELIVQGFPAGSDYSQEFLTGLEKAYEFSQKENHSRIENGDLFVGMAEMDKNFQRLLFESGLDLDDLKRVIVWEEFIYEEKIKEKEFWRQDNLLRERGVGKYWSFGYTPTLDKFSSDVSEIMSKQGFDLHLIARKNEIEQIENILSRAGENNCLVVGSVGSGRKTVALGFARLINQGKTLPSLNYKRVVWLDNNAVLTAPPDIFKQILNESLAAGNIILVIDEFHNMINLAPILEPYMASNNFQLIAITDYADFHKIIEPKSTLLKLLEKVEIFEPDFNKTIIILQDISRLIEKRYQEKIKITYTVLKKITSLSERYIPNMPFPEKAIDLLEEVVSATVRRGEKFILPNHVEEILSKKITMPIGEVGSEEKEKLLNLEKLIHQRIINQEEAVKAISEAMRRARVGVASKKKPFGTFLFLGPTGVGKTEIAKALSEFYFGSENRIIRLDMSEFQESPSLERIIGLEENQFAQKVRETPYAVILLDEIEKAHKNILNLFLQVLDEGYFSDVSGQKVSFLDTIIIATSNAGAEKLSEITDKNSFIKYLIQQNIFKPEFLNRFDAVVMFHPLSKENIKAVAQLMLEKLNSNLKKTHSLEIEITSQLVAKLAEIGFDPIFGARAMARLIQEKIETIIANDLIERKYKPGALIKIDVDKL